MNSKTFTIKEIAAANNLSPDTVARRIEHGDLPLMGCRDVRYLRPAQFRRDKAAKILVKLGYAVPE